MAGVSRSVCLLCLLLAVPAAGLAQAVGGVVVDQTGLPLPGATVQVFSGSAVEQTLVTAADGTFVIDALVPGDTVVVTLDGFQPTTARRADASRITLLIARASETTTVVAPATSAQGSPSAPLLGSTLTATTVARLPSKHMQARESLPLLPAVIRGPDGLMQLGGARAHETPLVLDGFNIGDPATGASSVNLPVETIHGLDVLRDPVAVRYGNLLGGLMKMDTVPGSDNLRLGFQGFVPRPRFSSPGFGRLEGVFPRGFVSGSTADHRLRYVVGAEVDFERIPVPGVTQGGGPEIVEQGAVLFSRTDVQVSPRHGVTIEGFVFPSSTQSYGLSPRRATAAAPNLDSRDLFAGATDRFVTGPTSVLTVQIGALAHDTTLTPAGTGLSYLTPSGWSGNWFSTLNRTGTQISAAATWERTATLRGRVHDVSMSGELAFRQLTGHITESPVVVTDSLGRVMRSVGFGPPAALGARDRLAGLSLRDVWHATGRVQIDSGVRFDHSRLAGGVPSARAGVRYAFDEAGDTVIKTEVGQFVGNLPLAVPAFAGYPVRTDGWFDPLTGQAVRTTVLRPTVGVLHQPKAKAVMLALERRLAPRLDVEVSLRHRRSWDLATFSVPSTSGGLNVESNGSGRYREVQVSGRRTWSGDQQLFLSYVRSSATGELNDFTAVFKGMDAALVQPGGVTRLPTDAPNRVLGWGTFNLPVRVVVSPAVEWHSGFLFSTLDRRYLYEGVPNTYRFPSFFSADMVIYKTITVRKRSADLGLQIFNMTNHRNPRDVYPVVGTPGFGRFTNSVGPVFRGYMLLKW